MLNWAQINKTQPKSMKALIDWVQQDSDWIRKDEIKRICKSHQESDWFCGYHYRELLFDFFDERGLHINLTCEEFEDGNNFLWGVTWNNGGGTSIFGDNGEYPTRPEAEKEAFLEAFKILESWL